MVSTFVRSINVELDLDHEYWKHLDRSYRMDIDLVGADGDVVLDDCTLTLRTKDASMFNGLYVKLRDATTDGKKLVLTLE